MSVGNSVHYLYDTLRPSIGPTAAFTGHATSSFFIKACFSPDGAHILSGSSDKSAYIWQVGACLRLEQPLPTSFLPTHCNPSAPPPPPPSPAPLPALMACTSCLVLVTRTHTCGRWGQRPQPHPFHLLTIPQLTLFHPPTTPFLPGYCTPLLARLVPTPVASVIWGYRV